MKNSGVICKCGSIGAVLMPNGDAYKCKSCGKIIKRPESDKLTKKVRK